MLNILKSRIRLKKQINIWYHPAYIPVIKSMTSYERYSVKRAKKILSTLRQNFLLFAEDLKKAPPAKWSELELFHDQQYLRDTTQNSKTFLPLGIQLDEEEQESWLESQRYMVGGTLEATKAVFHKKCHIAFNLGGGLHHAESTCGTGFCLYNDIGVSVRYLRQQKYHGRILIIDLDYHQGNGNMLGLKDDLLTFHYSLQGHEWKTIDNPNIFQINLPLHATDDEYLTVLQKTLTEYFKKVQPDLVYFIAGCDVLKQDYFGEFHLSLTGTFKRDQHVLELCKQNQTPLIITLGGGYSDSAWASSYYLLRYLLTDQLPKKTKEKVDPSEKHYARIAKKMHKSLLGQDNNFEFTQDDLFPSHAYKGDKKIFGIYSKSGIDMVLERYGIKKRLAEKGHKDLELELATERDGGNLLRVYSLVANQKYLIVETKLSTQILVHPIVGSLRFMKIDWLLAQNPLKDFSRERVALPGQKHPGLGLSQDIIQIFIQACKRLNFDGISHTPTHFHIALKTCHNFRYLEPKTEGRLMALKSYLLPYSLSEASHIAEDQRIRDNQGKAVWPFSGDIFYATSLKLINFFESKEYSEAVRESYQQSFAEHWCIQ